MKENINYMKNLVICLLICTFLITLLNNKSVLANQNINIKMSLGYEEIYKIGYSVPIQFEIQNNVKDIDGEIQVDIINEKNNINVYSKHVNLPKNSTKKVKMYVPIWKYRNSINVKIVEKGDILYENEESIKRGYSTNNVLIGILSDDFDSISYAGGVKSVILNNTSFNSLTVKLNENIFPDSNDNINMFDIIFINNFDTSKFTEFQYEALKNWVYNGGILILGTGASYNKTLSVFKDDFVTGKIGDLKSSSISPINKFIGIDNFINNLKRLDILEMEYKDAKDLIKDDEKTFAYLINKGNGVVTITAFDFGLSPISKMDSNEKLIKVIYEKSIENSLNYGNFTTDLMQTKKNLQNYNYISALSNMVEIPFPELKNIIIIFLIYLLLVSFASYYILKRKDKREYMWISVPLLSVIFIIIMHFAGISTRITKNIANVINIVDMSSENYTDIKSYASIFTPKKKDLKVQPKKDIKIYPMNFMYDVSNAGNKNNIVNPKVDIKVGVDEDNYIEYYNTSVFSNNFIKISNPKMNLGSAECELVYDGGKYTGTINNKLGVDLINCYALMNGNYIKIGDIKNEEIKNVQDSGKYYSNMNTFIENEFNVYTKNSRNSIKTDKQNIRLKIQERDIIEQFLGMETRNVNKNMIICFANTDFVDGFVVNQKEINKYEKSMIVLPVNIKYGKNKELQFPFGYFPYNLSSEQVYYDEYSKKFYDNGNYEVRFYIDKCIDVNEIAVKYELGNPSQNEIPVKQYIWNYKKGIWEEGDYRNYTISKDKLNKYLSEYNELKFKIEILENNISGELPKISVKGSAK